MREGHIDDILEAKTVTKTPRLADGAKSPSDSAIQFRRRIGVALVPSGLGLRV